MTTTVETAANGTMSRLHDASVRGFASDNYSGVHPEVLAALAAANEGHQVSYGEDDYTARLQELMEQHFGEGIECFPVFNGTGANVLSLQSLLPRWGAVSARQQPTSTWTKTARPERIGGIKLLQVPTPDGKLTPELIDREAWGWGDEHRAQPLAVSITQTTELGTCYTPEEVRAIADARPCQGHEAAHGWRTAGQCRGAPWRSRCGLSRAMPAWTSSPSAAPRTGCCLARLVVALNPEAAHGLLFLRKMNMQLASKMRFMSAQFIALLEGDLWLRSASHANAMAARLRAGVESVPGVEPSQKTESNGVFAILPEGVADKLRKSFRFYDWNEAAREVRWMCSFDTTEEDVDAFVEAIRNELARQRVRGAHRGVGDSECPAAAYHTPIHRAGGEPADLGGLHCVPCDCERTCPGSRGVSFTPWGHSGKHDAAVSCASTRSRRLHGWHRSPLRSAPRSLCPAAAALVCAVHGPAAMALARSAASTVTTPTAMNSPPGRFILLYDPDGSAVWDGEFRIVTYIRAQLEAEMGNDEMLGSVAWTWLVEALETHHAPYRAAGGTATRVLSESFGTLSDRPGSIDIELRASWTPGKCGHPGPSGGLVRHGVHLSPASRRCPTASPHCPAGAGTSALRCQDSARPRMLPVN